MTDPSLSRQYAPRHPETYRFARLCFTAALRQNDREDTAAAARALALELAQELDQGSLPIDQAGIPLKPLPGETVARLPVRLRLLPGEGTVPGTDKEGHPIQVPAPRVPHVVDGEGRVIEIPAPKSQQNERRTVPLELHTGAAWLSLALSGPEMNDAERIEAITTASLMFQNLVPDACRRYLAWAINEVRDLSAEPPVMSAEDAAMQLPALRARLVAELSAAGPVFAGMVSEAQAAIDPIAYAHSVYNAAPMIYGKLFSADLLRDLGIAMPPREADAVTRPN